jgi:hypothetical protein
LPVVGDHVVTAILAHAGQVRMRRRLEVPQDDFGGEFSISVAEKKRVHSSLSEDSARCLYLHAGQIADLS